MNKRVKYFRSRVKGIDLEKYTAKIVISDETLDRHGERVLVTSFGKTIKDFMKHPVLLSSHAYRGLLNQIGKFEDLRVEDKEVVGDVVYFVGEGNPEADWAWTLVRHGIAAFSIGFVAKAYIEYNEEESKQHEGSRCDYTEIELLETSQVLVPANPSALMKSIDDPVVDTIAEEAVTFFKDHQSEVVNIDDEKLDKENPNIGLVNEEVSSEVSPPSELPIEKGEEWEEKGWEETENEIRHRLRDPDLFDKFRYMTLQKSPKVNAVIGKLKGSKEWKLQALRFPKSAGWSIESAKKWVKDHPDVRKEIDVDLVDIVLDQLEDFLLKMDEIYTIIQEVKDATSSIIIKLERKEQKEEPSVSEEKGEDFSDYEETISPEKLQEMSDALRKSLGVLTEEEKATESFLKEFINDINMEARKIFSVPLTSKEQ